MSETPELNSILDKLTGGKRHKKSSKKSVKGTRKLHTVLSSDVLSGGSEPDSDMLSDLVGGKRKVKKSKKSSKKHSKKSSKKHSKKSSKKHSKKSSKRRQRGGADEDEMGPLVGGKRHSKKSSKKRSKKLSRGSNPGFEAFLNLKKKIAAKLGVSNSPKVGKVAGAVQKEIKEKHPGLDAVEVSKKAYELFESNMDKYKSMM